jgi:ATP-dependent DNA helicase RecQ
VLRGEERLMLRRERKPEKLKKEKAMRVSGGVFSAETDRQLWEALRTLRLDLARKHNVPPYVVFHDATLAQMVRMRPRTLDEFAGITGVGERKLAAYGQAFLDAINTDIVTMPQVEPVTDAG